jgi:hypothetical protein
LPDEPQIEQQGIDIRARELPDLSQRILSAGNWPEHQSMVEGHYQRAAF